jgi:hypothetical protein
MGVTKSVSSWQKGEIVDSLCIRCGESKEQPWFRCESCGLTPRGFDLIKSVYLSVERYRGDDVKADLYRDQLVELQKSIRNGAEVRYDDDLTRLKEEQVAFQKTPFGVIVWTVIRLFLPAALFIGGLFALAKLISVL